MIGLNPNQSPIFLIKIMYKLKLTDLSFDDIRKTKPSLTKIKPFKRFFIILYKDQENKMGYYKASTTSAADRLKQSIKENDSTSLVAGITCYIDYEYVLHTSGVNTRYLYQALFPNE